MKKEVNRFVKGLCTNHTGKMNGMISFSTSCKHNRYCIARAKDPKSICSSCYAQTQLSYQPNTEKKNRSNEWVCSEIMSDEDIPFINAARFRFEAFGDLQTVQQFVNYVHVAKKNPHCTFSLWTKNYFIVETACKMFPNLYDHDKKQFEKNFILIVSSPYTNEKLNIENFPMADKIFTVYSNKEEAKKQGVKINCGARQCLTCGRCYSKRTGVYVSELKK